MEVITVKFQEDVLKRIDESIAKNNFNSRTEFIREAVRDKLADLSKEELMQEFLKLRGKSRIKTTDEENERTREKVGEEIMRRFS